MPQIKTKRSNSSRRPKSYSQKSAEEKLEPFQGQLPISERHAAGKAPRDHVSRESHGDWYRHSDMPDPVEIVMQANKGRQAHLIPLRLARMIASPNDRQVQAMRGQ
ncbi:MAG TPA: hypothetical protein VN670_08810 [Acidobacteriaceae bacterium]|nr:hypothetical protein [Acidobacteriaceae bacterium]